MDDQTLSIKRSLLGTYRDRIAKYPAAHDEMSARHARELAQLNDDYLRACQQLPIVQSELEAIRKQVELSRNDKYQELQRLMAKAEKLAAEIRGE